MARFSCIYHMVKMCNFNLKVQTLEAVVFVVKSSACFFSRKVCHKLINLGGRVKLVHSTQAATKRLFLPEQTQPLWFCGLLGDFLARDSENYRPPEETGFSLCVCEVL